MADDSVPLHAAWRYAPNRLGARGWRMRRRTCPSRGSAAPSDCAGGRDHCVVPEAVAPGPAVWTMPRRPPIRGCTPRNMECQI